MKKEKKTTSKRELYNVDMRGNKLYVRTAEKGTKQKAHKLKCENCGIVVFTASSKAKYCSDSCRNLAYKKRVLLARKLEHMEQLKNKPKKKIITSKRRKALMQEINRF